VVQFFGNSSCGFSLYQFSREKDFSLPPPPPHTHTHTLFRLRGSATEVFRLLDQDPFKILVHAH